MSQETHYVSAVKINWLMLLGKQSLLLSELYEMHEYNPWVTMEEAVIQQPLLSSGFTNNDWKQQQRNGGFCVVCAEIL
jgi:hypothetical protein